MHTPLPSWAPAPGLPQRWLHGRPATTSRGTEQWGLGLCMFEQLVFTSLGMPSVSCQVCLKPMEAITALQRHAAVGLWAGASGSLVGRRRGEALTPSRSPSAEPEEAVALRVHPTGDFSPKATSCLPVSAGSQSWRAGARHPPHHGPEGWEPQPPRVDRCPPGSDFSKQRQEVPQEDLDATLLGIQGSPWPSRSPAGRAGQGSSADTGWKSMSVQTPQIT